MTKHRFPTGFFARRPQTAALALLLALPLAAVQAQGLHAPGTARQGISAGTAASAPAKSPRAAVPTQPQQPQQPPQPQQADFIVAVVNSEPITNSEVRIRLLRTEQQMQQQGMAMPPRRELLAQLLERMISDKAQLQLAQSSGLKIDENVVNGAVESVARQNQISVDQLRSRLKADGIDYAQFRSEMRDELLVNRLRQREVDAKVTVSEQDIDQYLNDQQGRNGAGAAAPQALNLAEILVAVPENATPAEVASLQAKAQQIMERARSGADFAALASEVSTSPTRSKGGEMGLRSADRYPPLFVEATQTLSTGGLAGPVRSGAGFHILKVIEKRKGAAPDAVITQTHARHILLRLTPQLTEAAAIQKLAGFKKRIAAGQADFATLARENSQDASAKEGGDLGWVNPGMFVPEFEKVMNGLAPTQVSEPLVSRFGVHLIEVLERRNAPISARDQREMVRGLLREKKQNEAYALWAQEVRGRAYVELREPPQ